MLLVVVRIKKTSHVVDSYWLLSLNSFFFLPVPKLKGKMCKSFIEVNNGKIVQFEGKLKKYHWVFCEECGFIKIERKKCTPKKTGKKGLVNRLKKK